MATAEQVQEALQQLQAQGARVAALETQLQIEQTSNGGRARKEHVDSDSGNDANGPWRRHGRCAGDRRALHVERDCRTGLRRVDTQSAHVHACKVRTALKWAARQRKIVVKTCVASQRDRFVPWITVFGEQVRKVTNMLKDGLGVVRKLKDGGKRQMIRMDQVQDSG